MEDEESRRPGVQPQGPLQSALGLQSGFRAPHKQGLSTFQCDTALLDWL